MMKPKHPDLDRISVNVIPRPDILCGLNIAVYHILNQLLYDGMKLSNAQTCISRQLIMLSRHISYRLQDDPGAWVDDFTPKPPSFERYRYTAKALVVVDDIMTEMAKQKDSINYVPIPDYNVLQKEDDEISEAVTPITTATEITPLTMPVVADPPIAPPPKPSNPVLERNRNRVLPYAKVADSFVKKNLETPADKPTEVFSISAPIPPTYIKIPVEVNTVPTIAKPTEPAAAPVINETLNKPEQTSNNINSDLIGKVVSNTKGRKIYWRINDIFTERNEAHLERQDKPSVTRSVPIAEINDPKKWRIDN